MKPQGASQASQETLLLSLVALSKVKTRKQQVEHYLEPTQKMKARLVVMSLKLLKQQRQS
jgi:hypothetical protein